MSAVLQLSIIICGAILLGAVLWAVFTKRISEYTSLFWIVPCIVLLLGGIFPKLIFFVADIFDVDYAPSLAFTFAIIVIFMMLFYFSCISTGHSSRITELTIRISLLTKENEGLQQRITDLEKTLISKGDD